MKYYLIAGEASGDLHASRLMRSLKKTDEKAQFRFFGGDLMAAEGGTLVKHYRELAYMGFFPVLAHLPTILRNLRHCQRDLVVWQPDVVILVDYPGFNLKIARYVKSRTKIPVYYYISPKIWAWKEYRIKNIKRDVDELFSILPFEVDFFERKHQYPVHYVGNPTAQEVREFLADRQEKELQPGEQGKSTVPAASGVAGGRLPVGGDPLPIGDGPLSVGGGKPIVALLAGSRRQEIKDNLPAMVEATGPLADRYAFVLAGAPSMKAADYAPFLEHTHVSLVMNRTYELLSHSVAALVTSGTATLETCLFGVPQVVCYYTPLSWLIGRLRHWVLKVEYVSLVNLIAQRDVVTELVADAFSVAHIRSELERILPGGSGRERMLYDYNEVYRRLGESDAPDRAAQLMAGLLRKKA
jgi:lipid-A-disaccharide synthase